MAESSPYRTKLQSIGWYATFGLLPFGTCLVGCLFLLIGHIIELVKKIVNKEQFLTRTEDESRTALLINRVFMLLVITVLVSGILSPKPSVGIPSGIGFTLLVYVFLFGGQILARDMDALYNRYLPVMVVSGFLANTIVICRHLYFQQSRTGNIFTGINGLGTIIIMVGGVAIGYLKSRGGRWERLIIPYLMLSLAALLASQSRGAWFGFVGMMGCLSLFNRRSIIYLLIIVVLFTMAIGFSPSLRERFFSAFDVEENMDRVTVWRNSLKMIRDFPLFGVGGGAFYHVYDRYMLPEDDTKFAFAHNIFLNVGTEFGLVGLTLFLLMLAGVVYMSFALARVGSPFYQGIFASLIGVLIHQQVDVPIWGMDVGGGFWMIIGLIIGFYRYEFGLKRLPSGEPTKSKKGALSI